MDFWSAKSKYGATIQNAVDYAMNADPKSENIADIFPHVAAAAAAYGDPSGKYAAFLKKHQPDYATQPFWYYDQSAAVPHSPAGAAASKSKHQGRSIQSLVAQGVDTAHEAVLKDTETVQTLAIDAASKMEAGRIPFVCPAVFDESKETELEDGLFVTCDELKSYYEIIVPVDPEAL